MVFLVQLPESEQIIAPESEQITAPEPIDLPALVFSVSIEGQIMACIGEPFPMFEEPQALVGELIFKVFSANPILLEAVCFALLGEKHESSIVLGEQNVHLYLYPVRSLGQPSNVLGVIIRE